MHKPMKKLLLGAAMLLFAQMGFGQSVSDNAVIPVSVTLNSILRLTVTSGGNIQFVVNTIDQYTNGIANSDQYTSSFTVSSSREFIVTMGAEDTDFIGIETGSTMPLENLRYTMTATAPAVVGDVIAGLQPLIDITAPETIVDRSGAPLNGAGGGLIYNIEWALGTVAPTLLSQNLTADIYVTNVFLNLVPQ